ncbi:MAG: hypothetical protein ACTS3F_12225 [Phycisphaerales bacterium]
MHADELLIAATRWAGFDHPPADSCVVHDTGKPITRALASINATTGDLLLAKQLGCDGYLLHHPLAGAARRNFHKVLDTRMVELITAAGVSESDAREAVRPLRDRCFFNDHLSDWDHLAAAAAHIGISLVNVHLPADEVGRIAMVDALRAARIPLADAPDSPDDHTAATIADALLALAAIPELAVPENQVVAIPDDPSWPVGRIAVMHAGGTNGGLPVAKALIEQGEADTVLYIHSNAETADAVRALALQRGRGGLIVTGHLAADAIGMNRLIEMLRADHHLDIIPHGGLSVFQ